MSSTAGAARVPATWFSANAPAAATNRRSAASHGTSQLVLRKSPRISPSAGHTRGICYSLTVSNELICS